MKRCIVCQSVYTDNTLKFCLQDGGALVASSPQRDPEATLIDASNAPTETWPDTQQIIARVTSREPPPVKSSSAPLLVASSLFLVLAVTGSAAYLLRDKWLGGPENNNAKQVPTPLATPAAVVKATPNQAATSKPTPTPKPRRAAGEVDFKASASSTRARFKEFSYEAENVRDGNWETAWVEGVAGTGIGESLRCDFGREIELAQITITPGFFKSPQIWEKNNRLKKATIQFSDGSSIEHEFADEMRYVTIDLASDAPIKTKWARLVIEEVYTGTTDSEDTAISDISFTLAH